MTTPPRVTIITPTIEGREALLDEAVASVAAQTEPVQHIVWIDAERVGPAAARNHLLGLVSTEFVGFLDDDDLLDPSHVEQLMTLLATGASLADLAWSRCRTVFADGVPVIRVGQPMRPDYRLLCRQGRNYIPVTVIARTASIRAAGGFDARDRYEDYALWCRMLAAGMRFAHLPAETWTYRFLGNNRTFA